MTIFASIKNALSERKAKKARRAAMSFNATTGGGSGEPVRPESPGTGMTGSGGELFGG